MAADDASEKTTFERVLEDFKRDLPDDEQKDYSRTTLHELKAHIAAIQARQKKTKKMQNMTRLEKFLGAMETYSKVADVFVNVHSFVAFIWGPMKFLLLTASVYAEAFNGLLDAYKNIGESLPLLEEYQSLFGKDAKVQYVLEMIFQDIFEFHRQALRYFRKPAWKQIFHATWSTFKTSIGPILESLKQHRMLLVDQTALEHYRRAETHRQVASERFNEQQKWEKTQRKTHLLSWLSAGHVYKYQEKGAKAREENPLSGNCVLRKDAYRTWSELYTVEPLLWIHGKPGIGKTVLASLIVEEMRKLRSTMVLSFYCRQNDPERDTFVAMARSFIWELLIQDDTLVDPLFLASVKCGELKLKTQKVAAEVLEMALQAAGKTCIIVDGIDECSITEQKHIVRWLKNQYDGNTKPLLSNLPALQLNPIDNRADVESYCKNWAIHLQNDCGVDVSAANKLAHDVAQYSEGIFLYARLMTDHLSMQTNLEDIENEMTSDALPTGLPDAYRRILERVLDPEDAPRRRDALQLLEWLVCATRPLAWEEIQAAICIDNDELEVNLNRRRFKDAHYFCGAIIEVGPKGEIELVHSTARAHLLATIINYHESHLRLSSLCVEYFLFPTFETTLSDDEIDQYLGNGAYGFFDYAIVNWVSHVELSVRNGRPSAGSLQQFKSLLERFMASHWRPPREKVTIPKHALETVSFLHTNDERLLKTIASMHKLTTTGVSDISGYATLDLFDFLLRFRSRMEHFASNEDDDRCAKLQDYYGAQLFKCSRLYCKWFYQGFKDSQERQSHVEKHQRPFHCSEPGCPTSTIGCTSKKDLEAHVASYHELEDVFPSDIPVEISEPVELDSPNTEDATQEPDEHPNTTSEREKHPDKPNEPTERPKTAPKRVRRPKTKHTCETCSKTFTRRYNLQTHRLETHSGYAEKEYKCGVCEKGFHRKADRKRHETIHSNHENKMRQPSQSVEPEEQSQMGPPTSTYLEIQQDGDVNEDDEQQLCSANDQTDHATNLNRSTNANEPYIPGSTMISRGNSDLDTAPSEGNHQGNEWLLRPTAYSAVTQWADQQ